MLYLELFRALYWYSFFVDKNEHIPTIKHLFMENTGKNKPTEKDQKNEGQTETTTPVNLRSGDKLRENPSNDEETIAQDPRKVESEKTQQSPLSRKHDDERNQVTNEDDQKDIVNPTEGNWEKKVD
jgi:hypothetical protein